MTPFTLLWLGLAALPLSSAWAQPAAAPARPNVLFIVADDLTTRLGCYGDVHAQTPALDRLASGSVVFDHAFVQASVCTPSRKSFLTGLGIDKVGVANNNYLAEQPDTMTLPRWFREHGYQTARVGKIEHTENYAGPKDWELSLQGNPPAGAPPRITEYRNRDGAVLGRRQVYPDGVLTKDQVRAQAFHTFLASQWDCQRPFFFALGFHSPHDPWEMHASHLERHALASMPLTQAPADATPMTKGPAYQKKMIAALYETTGEADKGGWDDDPARYNAAVDPDTQRAMIQSYYAAVTLMDEALAAVMASLEAQGLAETTIVVFTSDHGYFLGYRGMWSKHYLYPEVLRVPLLVRSPGQSPAGRRAEGIVELLDLFPTLAELAGLPAPKAVDGRSFAALVQDPARPGKEAAFTHGLMDGGQAVNTARWFSIDWPAGPALVRTGRQAVGKNAHRALEGLVDFARIRDGFTLHIDGEQRWIDLESRVEASHEIYSRSEDPLAWINLASRSDAEAEMSRHRALWKARFGH